MADLDIKCKDCGTVFQLSEGEQKWLNERFGADYKAPKRCRGCRQQRKLTKDEPGQAPAAPPSAAPRRRRDTGDEF